MKKITVVSKRLRIAFALMFVAVPVVNGLIWHFFNKLPLELATWKMPGLIARRYTEAKLANLPSAQFSSTALWLGFLADLIPTIVIMYGLYALVKLFRNYESGFIFSTQNAKLYRTLALVVFAKAFADVLYSTLSGLAFSFQGPVGERVGLIQFGTTELALIFIGCVVLLVSWVMQEASNLSDEQALTI